VIVQADRVVVRRAEAADNAARCELFARVAMDTDIGLSVRRDPDFDALYRLQSSVWESVVVERDGGVEGMGTVVVRDGYVGGRPTRVGYLGDLRLSRPVQGMMLLDRFFGGLLEDARDRLGCELFLTSVIASNKRAVRALTAQTRRSRSAGRPVYTPLGEFDIRSLHLLLPRFGGRSPFVVRRAREADIPALARMLDTDGRRRPFGFVLTEAELRRRLRDWPGLRIDSFLLAESPTGVLLGCLALWDAALVKRTMVTAYRGAMRHVRLAHDVAAALLGRARLPAPGAGEPLRYQYVTHQTIPSGDPRVLRALLEHGYRDARSAGMGYHFLSACAPRGSTLEAAFHGFTATNLAARLFVVSLPGVDVSDVAPPRAWPGFEMALV